MKKPTTEEVSKVLKYNNSNSYLWDLELKRWTDREYKEFEAIKNGKEIVVKNEPKERKCHRLNLFGQKVMRVSDGKVFESITKCRNELELNKTKIFNMLEEGKILKRI